MKLIPCGFQVNFHPGFDTTSGLPLYHVRAIIFSCSCRLMRFTISSMKRLNYSLTMEMANCRNALKTVSYAQVYARTAQSIHRLNRQLYERLCGVKEAKFSLLCANQSMPNTNDTSIAVNGSARIPTKTDKLVVTDVKYMK